MAAKVVIVIGLGYGDEGKGSVTDFLTRQLDAKLVVRYNGGAQASHAVVTEDGKDHRFSQFGSGTFAGAKTFLSEFMMVNPQTIYSEAAHLIDMGITKPMSLLIVDCEALITTPFHVAANCILEFGRFDGPHGSCGMGIGETMAEALARPNEALRVKDLSDRDTCRTKLCALQKRLFEKVEKVRSARVTGDDAYWKIAPAFKKLESVECADELTTQYAEFAQDVRIVSSEFLADSLKGSGTIVFEGAQGVLLDQNYGWAPHNTWSDCTFGNASKLLREADHLGMSHRIGVIRGYMTRHGNGPFVTEDQELRVPKGEHNGFHDWQHAFRMGHFDALALDYAIEALGLGLDEIALTCLDHLKGEIKFCDEYLSKKTLARSNTIPIRHTRDEDPFQQEQQVRQQAVGRSFADMKPLYRTIPSVEKLITQIEDRTKKPVRICSYGPRASDKKARLSRM